MAHEKEILDRQIWRKIEELTTVVEELTKEAKTKAVEESNEKEEGSEKECEEEGSEEDSEKEGKEPNKGESEEETKADAKEEDREDPDGEESEKLRGNDGEDRGKAIELEETEEGLKLVHGTGDWDSPTNICVKLVKLLEEAVADRYEDVNGSDGEYDVVVSLLMGLGTKMKVYLTAKAKALGKKKKKIGTQSQGRP